MAALKILSDNSSIYVILLSPSQLPFFIQVKIFLALHMEK